jgi:hypothetical protein
LKPFDIHVKEEEWKQRFLGAGSAAIMKTLFKENEITDDPAPWVSRRRELYRDHVAQGDLQPVPGFLSFYQSVQDAKLPTAFVSTGHPQNLSATKPIYWDHKLLAYILHIVLFLRTRLSVYLLPRQLGWFALPSQRQIRLRIYPKLISLFQILRGGLSLKSLQNYIVSSQSDFWSWGLEST